MAVGAMLDDRRTRWRKWKFIEERLSSGVSSLWWFKFLERN
jgi:hypothetical protein